MKHTVRIRAVKRPSAPPAAAPVAPPARHVLTAEPRDPWLACGPDTTVEQLWRVAEKPEHGPTTYHMVFFDPHGWYCEHGRNCPAVAEARRMARLLHDEK